MNGRAHTGNLRGDAEDFGPFERNRQRVLLLASLVALPVMQDS
jgi:hypothetical protein